MTPELRKAIALVILADETSLHHSAAGNVNSATVSRIMLSLHIQALKKLVETVAER